MAGFWRNEGGTHKKAKAVWRNILGTWSKSKAIWRNENGIWKKQIFAVAWAYFSQGKVLLERTSDKDKAIRLQGLSDTYMPSDDPNAEVYKFNCNGLTFWSGTAANFDITFYCKNPKTSKEFLNSIKSKLKVTIRSKDTGQEVIIPLQDILGPNNFTYSSNKVYYAEGIYDIPRVKKVLEYLNNVFSSFGNQEHIEVSVTYKD